MNLTDTQIQDGIRKNLHAASTTVKDLTLTIMDCDVEEAKKQVQWLISQSNGLSQLIIEAEKRGIELSR